MIKTKQEPQKLSFHYESIGNIVRLFVTIMFEKEMPERDISVFHSRFRDEPDETFQHFVEELYPNGCTVGENEINEIVEHVYKFMCTDEESILLYVSYDKKHYKSYVYFKPDREVIYADIGHHASIVTKCCISFFNGFEENELSSDMIRRFIRENFEIKSANSTMEMILNDADYILREIVFHNEVKKRRNECASE